jgi:hypothetical protein
MNENEELVSELGTRGSIPRNDKDLVLWGGNFVPWVAANAGKMGLDEANVTVITGHYSVYKADVDSLGGGNSSERLVAQKNTSKAVFVADCEGLIEYELRKPGFSEAELLAGGVRVAKKTYARDTQIGEHPETEFRSRERNEVVVKTRCEDTANWGIPLGKRYRGVEYRGAILESDSSPVPAAEDCPISGGGSRSEFTVPLGAGHSGKWFILYVRYTNHFPNPGPWGGPTGVTIL